MRRRPKAGARKHDLIGETLLCLAQQRQPRAPLAHLALGIQEGIFAEAELVGIHIGRVEQQIIVVLQGAGFAGGGETAVGKLLAHGRRLRLIQLHLHLRLIPLLPLHRAQRKEFVVGAGFAFAHKRIYFLGDGYGGGRYLRFVHRQQGAVTHQPTAVAHHILHIAALSSIDQARVNSLGVVVKLGPIVCPPRTHHNQIGVFAHLEASRFISHVQRSCAAHRG